MLELVKGREAADACVQTLDGLRKVKALQK
jgi:hypothetical protein